MRKGVIQSIGRIVFLVLSVVLIVSLEGCEKIGGGDYVVDWAPVYVCLRVTDGQGSDLLDPDNPDNMIDGTTISFKGVTYEASREAGPRTRAYLAQIFGLCLSKLGDGCYCLMFGQIDGAADMDEDLVVTLPNGMTGTIHYHCSKHNERKLSCKRSWKFNGVKSDGNVFLFVVSGLV